MLPRWVRSNPLLVGVAFALALTWLAGEALLGRDEVDPRAATGDPPRIVLPAEGEPSPPTPTPLAERMDVPQRVGTTVWVRGRVSAAERPLEGVVELRPPGGDDAWTTRSGPDGFFEVLLPAPGAWAATFRPQRTAGLPSSVSREVAIPDAPEHVLALELPGGRIEGRVLSASGEPVGGVALVLVAEPAVEDGAPAPATPATSPLASAQSDVDGRFGFALLEPGRYAVVARARDADVAPARAAVELAADERAELTLPAPE